MELVARKVESLRVEHPLQKVLTWEEMKRLVKEEVNGLVSEKQLAYICKCLADAGVVSYEEHIDCLPMASNGYLK